MPVKSPVNALRFGLISLPLMATQSSASGKRGLPFNTGALTDLFVDSPAVTWGYNWNSLPLGIDTQFEYVPMLWSDPSGNHQYIHNWLTDANAAILSGSNQLLAFNEPDINNLSPAQAASAYMTYMQPFVKKGVSLGAPAVTNGGPPTGLTWLKEFLGNCSACTIDFVPFHWYSNYEDISYFTSYVHEAYAAGGNRPLWLTEFQGQNIDCDAPATDAQQTRFIKTVVPWLDSLAFVERYAYFMATESSSTETFLLNKIGTGLTKSGRTYATLDHVNSTMPTGLVV